MPYLRLSKQEISISAHLHWTTSALFLISASLYQPSTTGGLIGGGLAIALATYAIMQGRSPLTSLVKGGKEEVSIDKEDLDGEAIWIYTGITTSIGAITYFIFFAFPNPWLIANVIKPYAAAIACLISLMLYLPPWEEWEWNEQPWYNSALALPLIFVFISQSQIATSCLVIVGIFYTIYAKVKEQIRFTYITLFMVDKRQLDPEKYYNLPKIYTHGVRASDMSGIGFKDCFVPDSMRLREEGDGLELALKGFQITRMLCAAFSHGAADTALRTTLSFAVNRVIYHKTVMDLPQPRRTLVDAFLDILICDCETIPAARGFHIIPEQFSVWASVVKYFVTVRLEEMVNSVYVVLGF